jgi:bacterioferritin-associated ferredoxin
MVFYCPNCQKEYELEPKTTVTTLQKRTAYKADCPVCGQDMAEFVPQNQPANPHFSAAEHDPAVQTSFSANEPQPEPDILPSITATAAAEAEPPSAEAQEALNQAAEALKKSPVPELPVDTPPETAVNSQEKIGNI